MIRLLKTDPDAGWEQLVREYGSLAAAVVRTRLLPAGFAEADVEDCLADSMLELYRHVSELDLRKGSLRAYLCVIARNKALDLLRRRREERLPEGETEPADDFELEESVAEEDLKARLLAEVRKLEEPDREIIVRKYYLGEPAAVIAEALGLSVNAVNLRAHRAVGRLKELLGRK